MYVDFFNYHGHVGEECAHCSDPLQPRKRGRYAVTLRDYDNDTLLVFHDRCYNKLKPIIYKFLQFSCSRCSCDIDVNDTSTYQMSRIYYDNAHDDDMTCTECMLSEIASANEDELNVLSQKIVRGTKRLLDDGIIDDSHAAKKMRCMNEHIAAMSRVRATTHGLARLQMIDQIFDHASQYETYMLCVHKKHLMDKCMAELMQKVWHPKNYDRWRHLIGDEDLCV